MVKEHTKAIKVRLTCEHPCHWDDLIDSRKRVIATIYTIKEGEKDDLKPGITKGEDGIYDIVVHAKEINNEVVRNALKDLEKVTRNRYIFEGSSSPQDEVISYAEKLMKPLKKYGDPEEGYDFSMAKSAKQKTEVIAIWIGEILYEALTYKDVEAVRSLTDTIRTEIEELINERI
ncbi:MAG: hypothetical protein IIB44_10695 [Candidatus Marinimicrobia bacterium]|nr:hypothetical protein [Candidatus Neomarinimicrobiota bacterium]